MSSKLSKMIAVTALIAFGAATITSGATAAPLPKTHHGVAAAHGVVGWGRGGARNVWPGSSNYAWTWPWPYDECGGWPYYHAYCYERAGIARIGVRHLSK